MTNIRFTGYRTRLINRLLFCFFMVKKKRNTGEAEDKPDLFERMERKIRNWIQFISYDIWRLNPENFSNKTNFFHNVLKTLILTIRNVQEQNISTNSASLTYRTVLSIVPILAILFAIARGFGFEDMIKGQLFEFMGTENGAAKKIVEFINNSLSQAQSGIFAGIGIVLLLYTAVQLFTDIENNLNAIWKVPKGRSLQRRVSDYFALILFLPVFMVLNSGLNIVISSSSLYSDNYGYILYPILSQLLKILPFLIIILILTLLYKFMPNAKVKFQYALIAGIVAGIAIQLFQMLYLSGQLWITRYNAIYGTFSAIPLMLLWLQTSWLIVLIGAELCFAAQNVRQFSFDKETKDISRRYRDFFTIIIASVIVKRFARQESPLTPEQLSMRCKVPIKLTNDIVELLNDLNIISPTPVENDLREMAFQPAMDINLLTVGYVLKAIDAAGSEDFMIDQKGEFALHWNAIIQSRASVYDSGQNSLLKDL